MFLTTRTRLCAVGLLGAILVLVGISAPSSAAPHTPRTPASTSVEPVPASTPTVTGRFKVGKRVRVHPSAPPAGVGVTYRWYSRKKATSNPFPIAHAAHAVYRLRPSDRHKYVFCRVTYHAAGPYGNTVLFSAQKRVR